MSEHAAPARQPAASDAGTTTRPEHDPRDLVLDALAIVGLAGFAVLTVVLYAHVTPFFDPPIRDALLQYRSWSVLWNDISEAANFPMIGIAVGLVLYLWWKHRRRVAVLVAVTLGLVTAGSEGVKELVHRPRPPDSQTVVPGVIYSFPSGHELEAVCILGILAVLVWRSRAPRPVAVAVAILVAIFCAWVAVARIAINAHWPSDVLAGFLGGIGVLAIVIRLTRHDDRGDHPADDTPDGRNGAPAATGDA
jgi:membrane-associated phospholipid phosphatase